MNRSDGALVRVMTVIAQQESTGSAEQRARALAQSILPVVDAYIPR